VIENYFKSTVLYDIIIWIMSTRLQILQPPDVYSAKFDTITYCLS